MSHIFISYSKKNLEDARRLRHLLQDNGFTIWMDETHLGPSDSWWPKIQDNISSCAAFIVIMSPEAKQSLWVGKEIQVAKKKDRKIVPVLLSGEPWDDLKELHFEPMPEGSLSIKLYKLLVKQVSPKKIARPALMIIGAMLIIGVVAIVIILTALSQGKNLPSTPALTETAGLIGQAATAVPTNTPEPSPTLTPTPDPIQLATTPVAHNADWTPYERDFDGVPMVLVPAGCFMMGSEDGEANERPVNQVCFNTPFWIDKTEVTNAQFVHFGGVAGRNSNWTGDNRPRERITWLEARDFCDKRGERLPTEAEWEYAARGPDGLIYPWGSDFEADKVVYGANSGSQTAAVGSRPAGASWVGALDMGGNVWEWVSSSDARYPYDASHESITNGFRILRGGAYGGDYPNRLRAAYRWVVNPNLENGDIGFRCARDL